MKKYPSVTLTVIKAIGHGSRRRTSEADKLLRTFTKNENPDVRAQALAALASDNERRKPAFEEVAAGLTDTAPTVRRAAVKAMRSLTDEKRRFAICTTPVRRFRKVTAKCARKILAMLKDPRRRTARRDRRDALLFWRVAHVLGRVRKALMSNPRENICSDAYDKSPLRPRRAASRRGADIRRGQNQSGSAGRVG